MASYIVKVERVSAPRNTALWVDLLMDKRTGTFSAVVGNERIDASTKDEAVAGIRAALAKIADVTWREVILLRVGKRHDDDRCSHENNRPVYSALCSVTYARRERAQNPLKKKAETIERDHPADFEEKIAARREREAYFEHTKADKKRRADEAEEQMRADRAALVAAEQPWSHWREDNTKEYELPYTPEAWAGIQRIASTLREMQTRLDVFASQATPEALALLGTGDVFKALPGGDR